MPPRSVKLNLKVHGERAERFDNTSDNNDNYMNKLFSWLLSWW